MEETVNEQEKLAEQAVIRRQKLAKLQEEGKNPYEKVKYDVDANSKSVKDGFDALEGKTVSLAGRLMSRRIMGKASFSHISDREGTIQLYIRRDDVGEDVYTSYKKDFDIGDIVGVKGFVFKTQTGEVSVHVTHLEMLSKALLPLPEKFNGLQNPDLKYRQRYVDLIVNADVKRTFVARSRIIKAIRAYLDGKGYLEVDTPVLHTLEIGAAARPFKTHHNALDLDMYLRIETELYLKRLIVGGLEKVYEVGRIFRNEGMDAYHNPEFTSIEMYQAYSDYKDMMDLIEDMYRTVTLEVCGTSVWWRRSGSTRASITTAGRATKRRAPRRRRETCAWKRAKRRPDSTSCSHSLMHLSRISSSNRPSFTTIPSSIPRSQSGRRTILRSRSGSSTSSAATNTATHSPSSTIPSIRRHALSDR